MTRSRRAADAFEEHLDSKLVEHHGEDALVELYRDHYFLFPDGDVLHRAAMDRARASDDGETPMPPKKSRATRFVAIPADRLMGELRAIGEAVKSAGGGYVEGSQGREVVVDVVPRGGRAMVRVYTSLAIGEVEARECGEDAVRLVVCAQMPNGVRPLEEAEKILRTAPAGSSDRVGVFLGRLRDRIRDAYRLAAKRPPCPLCGRAMARRKTRDGKREFMGCIGYPECKGTAPC